MLVLLETEYIKKAFGRNKDVEYYACLASLVSMENGSTTLKSSICRQVLSTSSLSDACMLVIAPGLVNALRQGNIFVATYATAALVNLSYSKEEVKNLLMGKGIARIMMDQLRSKDDDLMRGKLSAG